MLGDNNENVPQQPIHPINFARPFPVVSFMDPDVFLSKTTNKAPRKPRNNFTISSSLLSKDIIKSEQDDLNISSSKKNDLNTYYPSCGRGLRRCKSESENGQHHLNQKSLDDLYKPSNNDNDKNNNNCRLRNLIKMENVAIDEGLADDHATLLKDLEQAKKSILGYKVVTAFALEAFRTKLHSLKELRKAKQTKDEEAAARMILHNLLLNSWRNCKCELDGLLEDNMQLNKTMENLSLQLRVVRHLHTVDKEKLVEKIHDVERMKSEISVLNEDNRKSHSSIEFMENELNMLQANIQNIKEQNTKYEIDNQSMEKQIKDLESSLEQEIAKHGSLESDNEILNRDVKHLKLELQEVTVQNNHWQEQSRAFESESWGLKMEMDGKDAKIKDIQMVCENLNKDKSDLIRMKSALKDQLNDTTDKLEQANVDKNNLNDNLHITKLKMIEQINRIQKLEDSLDRAKQEYTDIEKELLIYKLKNVKRRRDWANALYFMVNPMDALKRSFSPSSSSTNSCQVQATQIVRTGRNVSELYRPRNSI